VGVRDGLSVAVGVLADVAVAVARGLLVGVAAARVEGVEPTNNVSERALRPAVLWRKSSFGSDSEAGSRFAERLLTVVATCRQHGRRLRDLPAAAGEAALPGSPPPSLLPAA
jgi:transposase